ncbi:MAG: hypothetical protein ACRDJ9_13775 [Dehalococcoidia bacterium]
MAAPPWMLVTAQLDPAVRVEFDDWHARVHLPRVLAIPGVLAGRRVADPSPPLNYAMVYVFENDAALRTALTSSEANDARQDWQRWEGHMRDLAVQFYADYEPPRPLLRQS